MNPKQLAPFYKVHARINFYFSSRKTNLLVEGVIIEINPDITIRCDSGETLTLQAKQIQRIRKIGR